MHWVGRFLQLLTTEAERKHFLCGHAIKAKVETASIHQRYGQSVSKVLAKHAQSPRFKTQHCIKLGVMMHSCNSSILAVEAGLSQVYGQYGHEISLKIRKEGKEGGRGEEKRRGKRRRESSISRLWGGLVTYKGSRRAPTLQCCPGTNTLWLQYITLPQTYLTIN